MRAIQSTGIAVVSLLLAMTMTATDAAAVVVATVTDTHKLLSGPAIDQSIEEAKKGCSQGLGGRRRNGERERKWREEERK